MKITQFWMVEFSTPEMLAIMTEPNQTIGESIISWARDRINFQYPEIRTKDLAYKLSYIGQGYYRVAFSSNFVT